MKLYLVRHGDYLVDAVQGLDVLSEQGTNDIIQMTHFLKPLNISVSTILHSEKNRAQQTAALLADGFVSQTPPLQHEGLRPDDDVSMIANEIIQMNDDVVLVGHLPFMGKLVSYLLTGSEDKELVNFQTCTLVCLEQINRATWTIKWMLSPEVMNS